jgi:hypothetical protein
LSALFGLLSDIGLAKGVAMGEIEDMAMKIFNAYEDVFYEKDKKKIFENLFDRYLTSQILLEQCTPIMLLFPLAIAIAPNSTRWLRH